MPRKTAITAPPLTLEERKARVAALVKSGELSKEKAELIDFREPTEAVRKVGRKLEGRAQAALARGKRAAA